MKLADTGGIIWLIIIVMIAIGKGLNKLQQPANDDSFTADDAPPVVRPRPRIPSTQPPPRPRPGLAPMARPISRAVPRTDVPRSPTPTPRGRKVDADDIRRFVEQLSGKPQPRTAPPVAPPLRKTEPPAPPRRPEPVEEVVAAKQPVATPPVPAQTSRASQWMEALRDRNNIRNIIISAEIIGPPKAESI